MLSICLKCKCCLEGEVLVQFKFLVIMKIQIFFLLLFFEILYLSFYSQDVVDFSLEAVLVIELEVEEGVEKLGFMFLGSVDVYYWANLMANNDLAYSVLAFNMVFVYVLGFGMGMFNFIGVWEGQWGGVVGDLVFGFWGVDVVFVFGVFNNVVNQFYVYWKVIDQLILMMGDFNIFLGYEVIFFIGNFNYLIFYMFFWGLFFYMGIKVDFVVSDDLFFMLGVFNLIDFMEFNLVGIYSLGGQIGYKGVYFNFLYGDQDGCLMDEDMEEGLVFVGVLFQVDLIVGWDLMEVFYLGLNMIYNMIVMGEYIEQGEIVADSGDGNSFYGVVVYLQYWVFEIFVFGLCGEYFVEVNGGYGIIGFYDVDVNGSIMVLIFFGNIIIGNLMLILELWLDMVLEDDVFVNIVFELVVFLVFFMLVVVYVF